MYYMRTAAAAAADRIAEIRNVTCGTPLFLFFFMEDAESVSVLPHKKTRTSDSEKLSTHRTRIIVEPGNDNFTLFSTFATYHVHVPHYSPGPQHELDVVALARLHRLRRRLQQTPRTVAVVVAELTRLPAGRRRRSMLVVPAAWSENNAKAHKCK